MFLTVYNAAITVGRWSSVLDPSALYVNALFKCHVIVPTLLCNYF